ncbi:hypothetical protein Pmani_014709 [Petrolisthes manimaculis]|uniref:Mutator-like transposase domain-containing protein n=1 Tax=Petrolisthes manimaculis TaxID=1843537 RepID=A0AAE1PSD2_9EUCA|nr:hypothetical protein Pmani_014709 [Petrolisthes manimaculis]
MYRRDHTAVSGTTKLLKLHDFKLLLSSCLRLQNKPLRGKKKRGQPSSAATTGVDEKQAEKKRKADTESERKYIIADEINLLEWVTSIARCKCGKKMKIKEESAVGMAKTYVARCGQCNIEQQMCTSHGSVKKSCRYDLHKRLVRGALHSGGYIAVRELCATLNMHPLSEKSYHQIAKEIQEKGIEEME